VLRLEQSSGKQAGLPEDVSQIPGTAIKLADLAVASVPATTTPAAVTPVAKKPVLKTSLPKKIAVPKRTVPGKRAPLKRPAAFVVPNARREPLDEIPLTRRAAALLAWIDKRPAATDANVKYWLYQHAWIVTGARMGWWHGDAALETLTAVDSRVWNAWGIGAASKAQAESALAFVRAKEGK
jgi:hypothetical protein